MVVFEGQETAYVYWPGMNSAVKGNIRFVVCLKQVSRRNHYKATTRQIDPWAKLGADLFTFQDKLKNTLSQWTIIVTSYIDRSYEVKTSSGTTYRRNRIHLKPTKIPALKQLQHLERPGSTKKQL